MLVISRAIHQSLMIGNDLELKVLKIRGTRANLHITRRLVGDRLSEHLFSDWLEKDRPLDLGNGICCAVIDIRGNPTQVRLGIEAPREISVHRKEVYDAIRAERPQ